MIALLRRNFDSLCPAKDRRYTHVGCVLLSISCACFSTAQSQTRSKANAALEEIVVTAQRREERLQDVPISISVLGGPELDKSTALGASEELSRVPGVAAPSSFGPIAAGTQLSVRGVSASEPLFAGSSTIAYYLDSVPFALAKAAIVPDSNAYDLERIEVLRGPQGTLYGSSALNGVVRVVTNDADPESFELKARSSVSNTEDGGSANYRGDLAINVPIVEGKLAARAVAGYQDMNGWIDSYTPAGNRLRDRFNDAEVRNARLKVNAQPTEKLSIGGAAWVSRGDYGGPSTSRLDNGRHIAQFDESQTSDYDIYGMQLGYEFPFASLNSSSSYIDYRTVGIFDVSYLNFPAAVETSISANMFSQELVLNSTTLESWRWSVGGFYRDATDKIYQLIPMIYLAPEISENTSVSYAVFGELTRLLFGGKLELTAGLRYFEDEVELQQPSTPAGPPAVNRTFRATFDKFSPRAVLIWHASDQLTTYASYSEGFRSGGHHAAAVQLAAPNLEPYEPDSLKNYEVGTKGDLWKGNISFDAAIYYIDWQDAQLPLLVNIGSGVEFLTLINSKSISGAGADLGFTFRPVDRLSFGVSFSWNDLKLDADVPSGSVFLFREGDRPSFAPEQTAGVSASYTVPVGGYQAQLSASANYTSAMEFRRAGAIIEGDSMLVSRASFTINSPHHWSASLFADNLSNEDGVPMRDIFTQGQLNTRIRPRTIGLQFEYKY